MSASRRAWSAGIDVSTAEIAGQRREPQPPQSLPVLLVFSHVRWGFLYQRPQHLMSRLAGRWRVLFVEEPMRRAGAAGLEVQELGPSLSVLVPHTPVASAGFHDEQMPLLRPLLAAYLETRRLRVDVAWLYTPMAMPLVPTVASRCVVYDCMHELPASEDAPHLWRQHEAALLESAALVLAGGPSLFEALRTRHPHAVCLPSAVDASHFSPSGLRHDSRQAVRARELLYPLKRPRLGYFGVIDRRLDMTLLAVLADSHPEWNLVMVGPVVGVDPATLPGRPNLHWLGIQPYDRLPHLLAGWDVCLLPFAQSEITRLISPNKTLEYMAGEKPVVSTPVRDVVTLYGDAVEVADGADAFVQACEKVLQEDGAARFRRNCEMLNLVSMHSWDRSADSVHALVEAALGQTDDAARMAAMRMPVEPPRMSAGGGAVA